MARIERANDKSLMDIDSLVAAQVQEMELVRQKVYSLEQTQIAIKQRYAYPSDRNAIGGHSLTLYCLDMRKISLVYAMSLRLVEGPRPMWVSAVCLRMGVFHNLTRPLSVMALAIYLVASWQTHPGKGTQAWCHHPKTSNSKVLPHTRCHSHHHQGFTNHNFPATSSHPA